MPQHSRSIIPIPDYTRIPGVVWQTPLTVADLGVFVENDGVADQYRIIRTKIADETSRNCAILITSPNPGDGKSTTAANLAFSLARRNNSSVLLLAGDAGSRTTWDRPGPGLSDILSHECTLEEALLSVKNEPNLSVLAAGTNSAQISDMAAPEDWERFGTHLRERFQHIVIDSPPFGNTSSYYTLQLLADGIVVVVRPEHTGRAALTSTLKGVPSQKMIGIVVNASKNWFFSRTVGGER